METLGFKHGVTSINLDTLNRTARYNDATGLTKTRPVQHMDFIKKLLLICEENKIIHSLGSIYASERQALMVNYEGEKENCPIENFLIQRLVTRVDLEHPDDTEHNMAIGIGYNEKGVSVSLGVNVHVCDNQCIFGESLFNTYGADKIPYDALLHRVKSFLVEYEELRASNYTIIQAMKDKKLSWDKVYIIIGVLFHLSVSRNISKNVEAPLNQTQIANMIKAFHEPLYKLKKGQKPSVWDLTQWGTHFLKPTTTDLLTIQDTTKRFNNFMYEKYCLN